MNPVDAAQETPTAPADTLHRLCLVDTVWAQRYEGWEELGRGSSARVVRTFSRSAGEDVALKIFPHLAEEDVRRFQREVKNAQRLASPFVIRTFSPFLRDGFAWIEMERVDGPNLRHELERRVREEAPFRFEEALEIAACIVRAVESAHACGVIHRDVKPANVLLPRSGDPRAMLGDFGVSRVAGSTRATATGLLPGTPQFVAPEVIDGQEADTASDVYSLCLTLHVLFAQGRSALAMADGASPAQWLRAQVAEAPIPIRRHDPSLPATLEALLLAGLAKDPRVRPEAAVLRDGLVALQGPGEGRRVWTMPRVERSPRAFFAGVAAGVLLAAAAAFFEGRSAARLGPAPPAVAITSPPASTVPPPMPTAIVPVKETAVAPVLDRSVAISAISADSISIVHSGDGTLSDLRVTLVGRSGARCTAPAINLGSGEDLTLGFHAFTPRPGPSFSVRTIELEGRTPAGPVIATLEARSSRSPRSSSR